MVSTCISKFDPTQYRSNFGAIQNSCKKNKTDGYLYTCKKVKGKQFFYEKERKKERKREREKERKQERRKNWRKHARIDYV